MQTRWCNAHLYQYSRFKRASPLGQTEVVTWFTEFKSATFVQHKWGTPILEFGSEKKFPGWKEDVQSRGHLDL
ncbi:hypothetical protein TNCV_1478261 [Trichonephila clavipes]|nr:hypothetical protein TNCV_1478261 [Trichonephila clavipes]